MINASDWEWFGYAGHFICGRWCRFHLCTKVGDYLISTVGQYVHPRNSGSSEKSEAEWMAQNPNGEEIGYNRFYETMVFKAGKPCKEPGCDCGLPSISGMEVDFRGYDTAGAATRGHAELCEKWATRTSGSLGKS